MGFGRCQEEGGGYGGWGEFHSWLCVFLVLVRWRGFPSFRFAFCEEDNPNQFDFGVESRVFVRSDGVIGGFAFERFFVVCWSCIFGCGTLCALTFGTDFQRVFFASLSLEFFLVLSR
jgi:hypothetical protein